MVLWGISLPRLTLARVVEGYQLLISPSPRVFRSDDKHLSNVTLISDTEVVPGDERV